MTTKYDVVVNGPWYGGLHSGYALPQGGETGCCS